MTSFVVVPQWQGSSSSRAMQLIEGAAAIAGDLPRSATTVLEIPVEAGEALGTGVRRASSLQRIRGIIDDALAATSGPVLLVGGDCGVSVAGIAHAVSAHPDLAVVWIDAHADLNDPASSPSGAFHGMALRAVLGEGAPGLTMEPGVRAERVVLVATRAFDDAEAALVDERGIRVIGAAEVSADAVVAAVRGSGASAVYVHLDLDALDPAEITGLAFPEPFGVSVSGLREILAALRAEFTLAGATVAEFSPSSSDAAVADLGAILRIVGALA